MIARLAPGASVDSAPTAVVRATKRPSAFTEPPITRLPGALATGRLSPVTSDSSTCERPSVTLPSIGTLSPGRTLTLTLSLDRTVDLLWSCEVSVDLLLAIALD